MFKYASLTKQGMALIAQATNLKRFIFTRMEYGNGVPEGFSASKTSDEIKAILCEMTSLVSKKADIGMYNINVKNNCATLVGKIISSSLTEDFFAKELGVYAKIDDGSDVLVAYFVSDDKPDPINQAALVGQEHKVVVDVAVGNAANITIEYSDGVYVTQWEFNAFEQQNAEEHAALEQAIADMVTSETITNIQQSITDEATARENADTALQQSITDEATARENADTALQQSITDEATARENADTALQQSIAALEASVDEKIGSIDISSALSHIKQYDFVVDSNETLLAWADCTDGSMKSVLVKSGEYTLDGKMINLVNAGTKFVFAEPGNKITVSNYMRGIGATEGYGAVIVGLNVEVSFKTYDNFSSFYRGMICYNCTGTSSGTSSGTGFVGCTCSNCTGTGTSSGTDGYGTGFVNCTCSNCTGTGTGTGTSAGYGFYTCTCSNCTGTGTSTSTNKAGYGFFGCSYCSSCRAGKTASTSATWGGINTYIDSDSCDYVAA